MKLVRYKRIELPPISKERQVALAALAEKPDSEIDYSDIPPMAEDADFWKNGTRGRFYRPVKKATSVRLDMDVLAWLKSQGRGYQTRMNAILRDAMLRER